MRMRSISAFCLVAIILPLCGEDTPSPIRQNQVLKLEISLAQSPSPYFIIDLQKKNILLKAKSLVLREWRIKSVRTWGTMPPLRVLKVEKKSSLFAPKRAKIRPGENAAGEKFELDVLELKDMPSSFSIFMSERIYVSIRPQPGTLLSRAGSLGRFFHWYFWVPLKNLWLELRKRPFTALDIRLSSREEAKALYWALGESFKGMILP